MTKTIQVGIKKPEPAAAPVQKPVREKGLLSKLMDGVCKILNMSFLHMPIKEDRNRATLNIRAIISPPPPGWDEYQQFLELSRRGDK